MSAKAMNVLDYCEYAATREVERDVVGKPRKRSMMTGDGDS
jgi:hypothetical protein